MRVVLLETGGWGGLWHYTCCLGNALCQLGVDVIAITSEGFEKPFKFNFRIFTPINESTGYLKKILQTAALLKKLNPTILHIQSWFSARRDWVFLALAKPLRLPLVVTTVHNLLPHDQHEKNALLMFWAYKRIYFSSDRLIVHSESNKEKLIKSFNISPSRIAVIKHGNYRFFAQQNFTEDRSKIRSELVAKKKGKKLFLIFGAIRLYKGIDLALEAMSLIHSVKRMHLIVAGKPYYHVLDDCKSIAEKLNISDQITFLPGYFDIEEVANIHAVADIVLFPYRDIFESGSLQIALAFGKPIIATRVGSFPETLNTQNAWLVEANSSLGLAKAIEEALDAPEEKLTAMGRESLRISVENHDWGSIASKTNKLYLRLAQ